ncbi:MAG: UDP-N-acetylmuramate--L-alanine ligase [Chitinophagales bacterium]
MELKNVKRIFFLGIGGIGMSALARYFKMQGKEVMGYDRTSTSLTDALRAEGMPIVFEDELSNYPNDVDLVIYTPAIPKDHVGWNSYRESAIPLMKRSEVLGLISNENFSIAVAGSHGKTTVSAMIAHILIHSGRNVHAFLGGIATNYNSNYLVPVAKPKAVNKLIKEAVVLEADEFDRSFHRLKPNMGVITAVDTDHLDIYGSKEKIDEAFLEFTSRIDEEGFLVIKQDQSIQEQLPTLDKAFYDLHHETADVFCKKYWVTEKGYIFTISYFGEEYVGFRLNVGGFHNIENALAAFTICKELQLSNEEIKDGLASFSGIKRRFEIVVENENGVYIDDYAHHPEEIRVFLESVKERYPERKITAVFQPHLFSRTKDLATEFASTLSIADELLLLDIYPARELPMEGVTSKLILDKATSSVKKIVQKEEVVSHIEKAKPQVVVTIGAGDIDKLVPKIKQAMERLTA